MNNKTKIGEGPSNPEYLIHLIKTYSGPQAQNLMITQLVDEVVENDNGNIINYPVSIPSKIIGPNGQESIPLTIYNIDTTITDTGYTVVTEGTFQCPQNTGSYTYRSVKIYFKIQDVNGVWGDEIYSEIRFYSRN